MRKFDQSGHPVSQSLNAEKAPRKTIKIFARLKPRNSKRSFFHQQNGTSMVLVFGFEDRPQLRVRQTIFGNQQQGDQTGL
jgi:hypothetical protein